MSIFALATQETGPQSVHASPKPQVRSHERLIDFSELSDAQLRELSTLLTRANNLDLSVKTLASWLIYFKTNAEVFNPQKSDSAASANSEGKSAEEVRKEIAQLANPAFINWLTNLNNLGYDSVQALPRLVKSEQVQRQAERVRKLKNSDRKPNSSVQQWKDSLRPEKPQVTSRELPNIDDVSGENPTAVYSRVKAKSSAIQDEAEKKQKGIRRDVMSQVREKMGKS